MKITVRSTQDYILAMIAVIGEADSTWLHDVCTKITPHKNYIQKLKLLSDENKIKKTKYDTYRLRSPLGLETVKDISESLFQQYMLISSNHEFGGSEQAKARRESSRKLSEYMMDHGAYINFYDIQYRVQKGRKPKEKVTFHSPFANDVTMDYRTVFDDDGLTKPFQRLVSLLDPDKTFFFTSKLLRGDESHIADATVKNRMSRIYGVLARNENMYPVYYITNGTEWSKKIETEINAVLRNKWWDSEGYDLRNQQHQRHPRGQAIFYHSEPIDSLSFRIEGALNKKKGIRGVRPWDVFDAAYFIPMNEKGIPVQEIILSDGWEDRLLEIVLGKHTESDANADAFAGGMHVWEFLTNDMAKLFHVRELLSAIDNMLVIAYPWQEELLRSLLGDVQIVTIGENDISKIINQLKES